MNNSFPVSRSVQAACSRKQTVRGDRVAGDLRDRSVVDREPHKLLVPGSIPGPATNFPGIRVPAADAGGSQFPASPSGCDPLLSGGPTPYSSASAVFARVRAAERSGLPSPRLAAGRIMPPPAAAFSLGRLLELSQAWARQRPASSPALDLALGIGAVICGWIWIVNLFT